MRSNIPHVRLLGSTLDREEGAEEEFRAETVRAFLLSD